MAANVHAIAVVADGARNPANLAGGFQHDGVNIRMPLQFQGCSQAGRPGANNDCCFTHNLFVERCDEDTFIVSYSSNKRQCFQQLSFRWMGFPGVEAWFENAVNRKSDAILPHEPSTQCNPFRGPRKSHRPLTVRHKESLNWMDCVASPLPWYSCGITFITQACFCWDHNGDGWE